MILFVTFVKIYIEAANRPGINGGSKMKFSKKILSVLLCVVMAFSAFSAAFAVSAQDDVVPVIFIPGIGQSQTYKYDDEGNVVASWNMLHVNTDFASYSISDWFTAVRFLGEFIASICVQKDVVGKGTVTAVFKILFADHLRDENGEFINNIVTPNYPYSVKDYDEEAYGIFSRRVPCQALMDEIGAENVFCYNYSIFSNTDENAKGLNDYIEEVVLPLTGASKVILVPMSMGATVANNYMALYPDAGRIDKVISVVGAWDGSEVFADLMLSDFDENAPSLVYTDAINDIGLVDPYIGSIINIAARILPKQEVDNLLYDIIDALVETLIVPNTSMISLCPSGRYGEFAAKFLADDSLAGIKAQTDKYAEAQSKLKERFAYQVDNYGSEFYFISGYNMAFGDADYGFFHFFESYDETNSDEVIQISSTAPGTSFVPAGQSFDAAYIADPSHNVSPDGSIDASTCYFPDTSWYFEGQKHELTDNNVALNLAYDIAMNKVKSVDDCRDKYPQFNGSRDIRKLQRDYLPDAKSVDLSAIDSALAAKLTSAIANAEAMTERYQLDREADDAVIQNLYNTLVEINSQYNIWDNKYLVPEDDVAMNIVEFVLAAASNILLVIFGEKGFADFWSFLY